MAQYDHALHHAGGSRDCASTPRRQEHQGRKRRMKKLITIITLIAANGFDNVNADDYQQRLQAKIEELEEKSRN
jgi:hypothetical protein